MKKTYFILFILISCNINIIASEINDYFAKYRQTNKSDYAIEGKILSKYDTEKLTEALQPYYTDTLLIIRQQAYYLTYRKGNNAPSAERKTAVNRLVKGIPDADSGLTGQLLGYLQSFSVADFDSESRSLIAGRLKYIDTPHYDKLVLLAGFIGVGNDVLQELYRNPGLSVKRKWYIALALARMGNNEQTAWCVQQVKKAPVNNGLIENVLPDLIYTRQKEAIDYCVELLFSDEKLCQSPNPDLSEKIPCAYRIIELLAPAIEDFPIKVDPSTGLESDDYPKTLQTVREWFKKNSDYKINKETFFN
ncbi:MAG: hypothetical protein LBI82_03720 [Dysgonamonadaceae bacterium]|jgi:hypothetical protein|nr:hypothetical protein [Dysgonamonadaceae bacterium]